MRELLIVSLGSFLGGGMRFLVSRCLGLVVSSPFPAGTLAVNILGCLLMGFFTSLPSSHGWLTPHVRLLLTTGFCGGFTTFSTFVKEGGGLLSAHMPLALAAYLGLSLVLGMAAFWLGCRLGSSVA